MDEVVGFSQWFKWSLRKCPINSGSEQGVFSAYPNLTWLVVLFVKRNNLANMTKNGIHWKYFR